MTFAEFKRKWERYQGKETSAYQEHFCDLCRLLGHPTPAEADPSGTEFFCFQKRVLKDAELFHLESPDAGDSTERGFADVWKKGCFGWEYKGKKKNLNEAYQQLQRYREALENPPLLVVCDFDRYIIQTNFNGRKGSLSDVVEAIGTLVQGHRGNYLVYFPSYQYLNDSLQSFRVRHPSLPVLVQRPGMSELERDAFLASFTAAIAS